MPTRADSVFLVPAERGKRPKGEVMRVARIVLRPVVIALAASCLVFLTACLELDPKFKIPDVCKLLQAVPLTNLAAPDPGDPNYPKLGFPDQGEIMAMYGFGNAKLDSGGRVIRVEQSVTVPAYANHATV